MADYFYAHRGRYPLLADAQLPAFNWVGLAAYFIGALCAYLSPWVAPIVGILVGALAYVVLFELQRSLLGRKVALAQPRP
jgi:cytosine permease